MTLSPVIESGPLDEKGKSRILALAQDEVAVLTGASLPVYVMEAGSVAPTSNLLTRLFRRDYANYTIVTQAILTDSFTKTFPSTDTRLEYDLVVTVEGRVISAANYLRDNRRERTIISPIRAWLEGRIRSIISQYAPNQISALREALQNFATYLSGHRPTDGSQREACIELVSLSIDLSFSAETKKLIDADTIRGLIDSYGPSILLDMAAAHPERAESYRSLYRDRMSHHKEELSIIREAADVASSIADGDAILEQKLRGMGLLEAYGRVVNGVKSQPTIQHAVPLTDAILRAEPEAKRLEHRPARDQEPPQPPD